MQRKTPPQRAQLFQKFAGKSNFWAIILKLAGSAGYRFLLGRRVNRLIINDCYDLSRFLLMNYCIPVSWYATFSPVSTPRNVAARINAEA
jgi:hypothetical protein